MDNFTFIPNHIDIKGELPFELLPAYHLRKASLKEIAAIDQHLDSISSLISKIGELPYRVFYSFEHLSENEVSVHTEKLSEKTWKFYVVEYEGHGELLYKVQLIANLFDTPLALDLFQFEKEKDTYSFLYTPDRVFRFFADYDLTKQLSLTLFELNLLRETFNKMCKIEEKFSEVMNSIYIFNSLRFLPQYNEYKILGLFTVLESLITHKPSSKETGDSLTHQIKSKIPLLFNRLQETNEIEKIYQNGKLSTIWGKLYDYRSCIAHGIKANFEKDLNVLENPMTVTDYLTQCVKKLILLAINEPQLMRDLKKC